MIKYLFTSITAFYVCCNVFAENGKPLKKQYLPAMIPVADTLPVIKPEISISNTLTNSYNWRGFTFNEGLMVQPSVTVGYGNWQLNGWSNIVAIETCNGNIAPEMNFSLGYTYEKNNWGVTPQASLFFYPSNSTDIATVEIGAELHYELQDVGFYVNPNIDVANNMGGFYVDYGLYRGGNIGKKWSYDARFLLGWGNKSFSNFYKTPVVVETNIEPTQLKPEVLKSMRIQATANYNVNKHLSFQPQLIAFRNFMTEYSFRHSLIELNGSVSCTYAF